MRPLACRVHSAVLFASAIVISACDDPVYFGVQTSVRGSGQDASQSNTKLRIFITKTTFNGDLRTAGKSSDGLTAADALCQLSADTLSLGGTFRAYIGTKTVNAIDRVPAVGPWTTLPTAFGSSTVNDAKSMGLAIDNLTTETGDVTAHPYWSGAGLGGVSTGKDCDAWTHAGDGINGHYGSSTSGFTGDTSDQSCSWSAALLCFEIR